MTDFLHPSETQQTQPGNVVVNVGLDLWKSWANGSGVPNAIIGVVSIGGMPGTPITVVTIGRFPLTVFNLGAGIATTVVAGNTPSRNVSGGLVIGTCDASGEIFLSGASTSSSTGFFSPGADTAGGGTSTQANQYVSSLSGNATGFLHGAAPAIAVNGTGAALNWVDDNARINVGGTTQIQVSSSLVTLTPATLQWGAAVASPTITQVVAAAAGTTLSVIAQSAGGIANAGGALLLQSGSATTTGTSGALTLNTGTPVTGTQGSINFNIAGVNVISLLGSVQSLSPGSLGIMQWGSTCGFPAIEHGAISTQTQGANFLFQPQRSAQATNFGGGNLNVNLQTPGGSGVRAYLQVLEESTTYVQIGRYASAGAFGALYVGSGLTPGATNYALQSDGTTNSINASTTVSLQVGGATQFQVGTVTIFVTPAQITWTSAAVLPTLSQIATGAASGVGQSMVVQAQNATGTTSTGGNLALSSGTGTSVAGALNLQVGAVTQIQVNGAATTITITPATLQWASATSSPTITQLSVSNQTQGQNLLIQPQQSTQATNFGSGGLLVNFQVPGGSGARALFQIQEGGTGFVWAGHATNVAQGCLWLGNGITPAVGNFALRSDGTAFTVLNVATGGTINFSVNSGAQATLSTTAFNIFAGATIIQPWTGTANTQTQTVIYQPAVVRTTTTAVTPMFTFNLAAHKAAVIEVWVVARVVVIGTGWSPVDAVQSGHYRADVSWNGSGSATLQSSGNIWQDTTFQSNTAIVSFTTGANGAVTVNVTPSDSTSPTIDWEAMIMIVNN